MSFLSRFFGKQAAELPRENPQAATQAAGGGVLITNSAQLDEYLRSGGGTSSGPPVTPESAMRQAVVYRCNALVSGAVATLSLSLKRKIDQRTREDAENHPLWNVLKRKPNRWQTPSEFRRMLQSHVNMRGNGYALPVRSRGMVLELIPLDPDRMNVKQAPDLTLSYEYQRVNGSTIVLQQSEVFHLRGLTLDGVTGVSVIRYAREAIGLASQTEKHGAMLFKNGAMVGLVLEHPNQVGKEALENLKASLEDYRGTENAHKSLVLEEGMKLNTNIGMTSEDAQFLDTRKFQRSDIAMFFGVPPHMIGDTEKSTSWGTGIEQQSIGFVTYTLEDHLTMWEEAINRDLIGDNDKDLYAKFNRASLLKGDSKTRWEAYVKAMQWGVMSPNEVRALEDQNPREGGDIYYPPPNTAGDTEDPEKKDDTSQAA